MTQAPTWKRTEGRVAQIRALRAQQLSRAQIAARLGLTCGGLASFCQRRGIDMGERARPVRGALKRKVRVAPTNPRRAQQITDDKKKFWGVA